MSDTVRVAAAIIERDGKVLAAQRHDRGGGWEFPGGKIEPGETSGDAVVREIREELGVRIISHWLLDTIEHDYETFHLSMDCHVCHLADTDEPQCHEHAALAWVGRDELLDPAWLPADRKVVQLVGTFWDHIFASEHM